MEEFQGHKSQPGSDRWVCRDRDSDRDQGAELGSAPIGEELEQGLRFGRAELLRARVLGGGSDVPQPIRV